ncbi:hypothetical protein NL676_013713 [Syzygium grande]|nr:hypothetical protein NL676_013713 [Syzygium grande]
MAEAYEDTWQAPPEIPAFHCRGILRSWVRCNRSLAYAHNVRSTVRHHRYLNSRGCCALIYSGDHDMVIPYLGTQSWIKTLNVSIVDDWRPWMVGDQVARCYLCCLSRFSREYSNGFTFATVKGGSHTAPEYLPEE